MRRRAVSILVLLVLCSLGGPAIAGDLALKRVMLSTGGVAYLEYEAEVEGDARLTLNVPLDQVDDVLKSIVVGPRPRSIAFLPDGSRAYVPSENGGTLSLIDTKRMATIKTITLGDGIRPMGTAMAPNGKKLYLSTGRGGTVCVVDTSTQEVVATIKVGPRPWGLAISPDGKWLYVANGPSNDISVVDLSTDKEVERVKAGEGPWGVAVVQQSN